VGRIRKPAGTLPSAGTIDATLISVRYRAADVGTVSKPGSREPVWLRFRIPRELTRRKVPVMSATDKVKNKVEDVTGKVKETVGHVTGDSSTKNEGKADQAKSNLKDAGEKVKDAFKN
jgi:uncharacterized protein YjbJ (UPF0337 family)